MAYTTYTTDALVCGSWSRSTADGSFLLFTREAGMLYADAKSVREERSRQRYALQDFTLVRISLVKGKQSWKIGSIESKINFFFTANSKGARGSVVLVCKLLRRFLRGQEAAPALYDYVIRALALLSHEVTNRVLIEKIIYVRLLLELGYVDEGTVPAIVHNDDLAEMGEIPTSALERELQTIIDKAVATSHL